MEINVHAFTLTTGRTATIKVTADSRAVHHLPSSAIKALAAAEALELTGFEWEPTSSVHAVSQPAETYLITMNRI